MKEQRMNHPAPLTPSKYFHWVPDMCRPWPGPLSPKRPPGLPVDGRVSLSFFPGGWINIFLADKVL